MAGMDNVGWIVRNIFMRALEGRLDRICGGGLG